MWKLEKGVVIYNVSDIVKQVLRNMAEVRKCVYFKGIHSLYIENKRVSNN